MNDRDNLIAQLARAIAAVAAGKDDEAAGIILFLAESVRTQQSLPGIAAPVAPVVATADESRRDAARRLFAYWQAKCDHATAKLTPERGRAIVSRLRDGYTEDEIRKAIDGASAAAFVNEENGRKYDDLTLICRNGSKLEDFMARGIAATGAIIASAPVTDVHASVEEKIRDMRRAMATMKRDGRETEYDAAERELRALMAKRAA